MPHNGDVISELAKFYNSLENLKSYNIWNINKEIAPIECDLPKEFISEITTERKVLSFNLNKGDLVSSWTYTEVDGTINNTITFSQTELDYLHIRLNKTCNIFLLARYAHILWLETKNNQFAETAIINYINIINSLDKNEIQEIYPLFSVIFKLSKKTKKRIDEIKLLTLSFLNHLPYWLSTNIICSILENNIFTQKELHQIADKLLDSFKVDSPLTYFANKNFLEILLELFDRIKKSNFKIYEFLALNEDIILVENDDDTSFIKLTTTGTKARYLKRAKKTTEYELTIKEYTKLKKTVNLPKHTITFDDDLHEKLNKYLNLKGDAILNLSGESILAYFAVQDDLVVDPKKNRENTLKRFNGSMQQLFNSSVLDINNNFKQLTDIKDKIDYQSLKSYTIDHNIRFYTLFLNVFNRAIISGKINYYTVLNFLRTKTWYGIKFKRSIGLQEIDEGSSWISLLAPGIYSYFSQYEMYCILNTNKVNNYILAIDSLTLKFEGALRDFIRLAGGSTTTEKRNELQEQLLEELLENATLIQYFEESDIELFKFIFTKRGKNIRNNVAHSFMEYSDYSLQTASSIFFCLLRLGKYTFEEANQE